MSATPTTVPTIHAHTFHFPPVNHAGIFARIWTSKKNIPTIAAISPNQSNWDQRDEALLLVGVERLTVFVEFVVVVVDNIAFVFAAVIIAFVIGCVVTGGV